jgi:DNA-binding LytR/AlgR family response regulator
MKKLRVAACDDEPELMDIYARYITECFAYHNIKTNVEKFSDPLMLKRRMAETSFDLLFLDIDMPRVDGITLARELRRTGNNVDIIYISSKEELVFKVFDIQPYSLSARTRFLKRLPVVVRSYVETHESGDKHHLIIEQKQGDILTIDLNQTLYFEGDGKNQKGLYVFAATKPLTVKSSMREFGRGTK